MKNTKAETVRYLKPNPKNLSRTEMESRVIIMLSCSHMVHGFKHRPAGQQGKSRYNLIFHKNTFYKEVEAEICKILRIFEENKTRG